MCGVVIIWHKRGEQFSALRRCDSNRASQCVGFFAVPRKERRFCDASSFSEFPEKLRRNGHSVVAWGKRYQKVCGTKGHALPVMRFRTVIADERVFRKLGRLTKHVALDGHRLLSQGGNHFGGPQE